ncbi:MAG TPA: hypothetical protein VLD17_01850 [Gemmatimonadaceae bacterium]|nr:hypothetical protein [Gemmatimonadaceae bacterium]
MAGDLRFLKGYAYGATTLAVALSIVAFRQARNAKFDTIDVQRINIVEADGTLRMTLSGHDKLPDPVIGGKSYPLRSGDGGRGAGVIFFNDEGNEDGGLTFNGRKTADGYTAGAGLTFDQYNQDETVTLSYHDQNGAREAGLDIQDRPNVPIQAFAESAMVYRKLPDGSDKTRRFQEFRKNMIAKGEFGSISRAYIGKGAAKESIVMLSDRQGHPRIKLMVDSLGTPSLQFLDADGRVTQRLPEAR